MGTLFVGCGLFCKSRREMTKSTNQEAVPDSSGVGAVPSSSQVGEAPKHRAPDQEEIDRRKEELLKEKRKNRQSDQ